MHPHTPRFYHYNAVDYDFQSDAFTPKFFLRFLESLWGHDPESIGTLQEIFGYLLTPDTKLQKIFLIVGPKRSGKGTIARILTGLIGQANICAPTLASLGQNFGLSQFIGKRAAIIPDARFGGRTDPHVVAERLLSISGEDSLTIDRKYLPPWTGRLSARIIILTNELPRIADVSGALASRFIVLILEKSFFGSEDHGLTDRLLQELPAILNWAIEGWHRLKARGFFLQPLSSAEAIQDLEDLGSPIRAFLRDCCELKAGTEVETYRLFAAWKDWCEDQGRDRPGNAQSFGRDLRAVLPGIRTPQRRTKTGVIRVYVGLRLLENLFLSRDVTGV